MAEPIIRIQDVTRVYRVGEVDVHALSGVSLVVEPSEFVAIMGSSGSGKSTLMSTLGCLDRPTSGDYYFEGVDVALLIRASSGSLRDGQIVSDERRMYGGALAAEVTTLSVQRRPIHEWRQVISSPATGGSGSAGAFATMVVAAAIQALARNKMRSALTMLGVFIGVAALIAMVAVGEGANEAVRKQIESLGTNLMVVLPGGTMMGGMRGGLGSASTLTVSDAQAIRREASAVGSVSYLIRQTGQVQYANQNWTTGLQGVSPNYTNWQIAAGRGIAQ